MSDEIPREQVETALEFLEWSHGDALRRPWSHEAWAYYQAIDILEAAMNEELLPPGEVHNRESDVELIQQSREAREEGFAEATNFHSREYGRRERRGFVQWFKDRILRGTPLRANREGEP